MNVSVKKADSVEWVYKNGDSGQQYLSIVYVNGIRKQWLFYPDYIIKTTDGNVWIIETKGGMQAGHTKNIDRQVENSSMHLRIRQKVQSSLGICA